MSHPDHDAPPVNPLPPAVSALALALIGVEAMLAAGAQGWIGGPGAIGWRQQAIRDFGFPGGFWGHVAGGGTLPARDWARVVTYPFVHWSFTHAAFAVVFVLALGKAVAEALGNAAMLAIFFGACVAATLAWAAVPAPVPPLAGAFPWAFGLIGGFTFLLWARLQAAGGPRWQAFRLIAALMAIQLVWRALFGGPPDWVADLAGFAAGFALAAVTAPGGLARLRDRLRLR